ncbi:hypothetical protein [Microbispora sp. NPDC049633]|uniref:hypothetical protein n=1 Tax=Microbispora sp. NPDC049633 TaxID=3154355 RepID=UPI00342716A6
MTTTNPRRKAIPYTIEWEWRSDVPGDSVKTDSYEATDALRAVAKLRRALTEEYANVSKELVILDVYRV